MTPLWFHFLDWYTLPPLVLFESSVHDFSPWFYLHKLMFSDDMSIVFSILIKSIFWPLYFYPSLDLLRMVGKCQWPPIWTLSSQEGVHLLAGKTQLPQNVEIFLERELRCHFFPFWIFTYSKTRYLSTVTVISGFSSGEWVLRSWPLAQQKLVTRDPQQPWLGSLSLEPCKMSRYPGTEESQKFMKMYKNRYSFSHCP